MRKFGERGQPELIRGAAGAGEWVGMDESGPAYLLYPNSKFGPISLLQFSSYDADWVNKPRLAPEADTNLIVQEPAAWSLVESRRRHRRSTRTPKNQLPGHHGGKCVKKVRRRALDPKAPIFVPNLFAALGELAGEDCQTASVSLSPAKRQVNENKMKPDGKKEVSRASSLRMQLLSAKPAAVGKPADWGPALLRQKNLDRLAQFEDGGSSSRIELPEPSKACTQWAALTIRLGLSGHFGSPADQCGGRWARLGDSSCPLQRPRVRVGPGCFFLPGWMDGWMDGLMNGWTDGWMDGWTDGWMDGLMWMDRWMDGWMDGWMNEWMDGRMDGYGWMDGWMWMDG